METTVPDHIEGLIFDCDGTLADTMPLHWEAWSRIASKYGIRFTEERFYALGGMPTPDVVRVINRESGTSFDPDSLAQEKEAAYLDQLPKVTAIEPVVAVARAYKGRLPMAVASGGRRDIVRHVIEGLGIADWFDAVVTCEDVQNQKPAPDMFLEAARRLKVPADRCQAYEDSVFGIQAIEAAGMRAIDIREWVAA